MRKVKGKLLIIFAVTLLAAATALGVTLAVRRGGVSTSYAADSTFSVGAEGYDDFASAMNAAKTTSSATQRTVTMNSDYTLSSLYTLDEGYYATLDLNGHTLDCSSLANAIDVYGTLTLRDGTDAYGTTTSKNVGVSRTSSGTKPYRTIYSSSTFSGSESNGLYDGSTSQSYKYYDSGAIIGCRKSGSSYAYYDAGTVRVLGGGTFNMYGGTITGANAYFGGAVNVCGTDASGSSSSPVFNMYGGSVSGNTSTSSAAGILVSGGGEANLAGGIIAHNECTASSGGGADVTATDPGSTVSLGEYKTGLDIKTPLIISGGSAGYGAGVGVWDGAVMYMYEGTEISNNVSTSSSAGGGAVAVSGAAMYMYGGKIIDNTAVNKGGAVYITGGTFVMSGGEVSFNGVSTSAYGYGSQPAYGGSFYVSGTFEMTGGSILSSVADTYGGAIYVDKSSSATMSGGTIMGCASYSGGGAVYVVGTGEFDMSGTADITLNSTSGTCGAGVFVEKDATFDMSGGTIEKGVIIMSSYGGVGVYVDGTFVMTGGAIKDNSFTFGSGIGGGVYLSGSGTMYMYGGVVTGNSALTYAGGIYAAGSLHVMGGVTVSGNTCGSADSNIYL
ncbi:MAG: hypothetical protein LUD47_03150, partial [Clostridia bacterium]|nr:hypothetical protein [Clostridia bacterium]